MSTLAAHRNHPTYWAFVLHRVSGLALALFLPVHLYVLSLVIDGGARFDAFIDWTAHPLVKAALAAFPGARIVEVRGGADAATAEPPLPDPDAYGEMDPDMIIPDDAPGDGPEEDR